MKVRVSLCLALVYGVVGLLVKGVDADRRQKKLNEHHILSAHRKFMERLTDVGSIDITFTLYTRKNQTIGQTLQLNSMELLRNSDFDARKRTRFVTHGYMSDGKQPSCTLIRDAYLSRGRCNVIIVDWSEHSHGVYHHAARKVKSVGHEVAKMINFLYKRAKLRSNMITLVGHSLGAHVMGIAGYNTKYQVNFVVGLDPARPHFITAGPERSISTCSGKHVQLIHTNGGFLGYLNSAGHSDFFPNGGTQQPGCSVLKNSCSHMRAYRLFAESIETPIKGVQCGSYKAFKAGYCESHAYVAMGLRPVPPGNYYLRTGSKSPYSVL